MTKEELLRRLNEMPDNVRLFTWLDGREVEIEINYYGSNNSASIFAASADDDE